MMPPPSLSYGLFVRCSPTQWNSLSKSIFVFCWRFINCFDNFFTNKFLKSLETLASPSLVEFLQRQPLIGGCREKLRQGGFLLMHLNMHRKKKVREFPVPSRDVTTKLSLGGNNDVITELFLPRGSLVSDIPGWRRETREPFFTVWFMQRSLELARSNSKLSTKPLFHLAGLYL
jgi:hypothetical protein